MKDKIIACLEKAGWQKDRIVNAFSKIFETGVVPVRGSIWLRLDREFPYWWLTDGDFTSAGENVLAGLSVRLPLNMKDADIEREVAAFVQKMEQNISRAWSVRLLYSRKVEEGSPSPGVA